MLQTIMLIAGICVPMLAALNAALGRELASPALAAAILFCVALAAALVVWIGTGASGTSRLAAAPRHLFLGGVLIAVYVLSITWIAPIIGVGNAVFFVLLGQLIAAALIDHFGLFGAKESAISLTRAAGIALMAGGVFLTQRA